jgi:TonB family protein
MGWKSSVILFCMLLVHLPLSGQGIAAPGSDTSKASRKCTHMVQPLYPRVLKEASIGGVVKLQVQVSSKGTVEQVSVLGGNPIFADVAIGAIKKWKYAPADSATLEHVSLVFDPNH